MVFGAYEGASGAKVIGFKGGVGHRLACLIRVVTGMVYSLNPKP